MFFGFCVLFSVSFWSTRFFFILLFNTAIQQICYQTDFFLFFFFFFQRSCWTKANFIYDFYDVKQANCDIAIWLLRSTREGGGHCFTVHEHT